MITDAAFRSGALLLLCCCAIALTPTWASEQIPPGLYEVTRETNMPHLEESLRYLTTRDRQCLLHREYSKLFTVLEHPSLHGCNLAAEKRSQGEISYLLVCEMSHGTTGHAIWHLAERRVVGTLHVTLGAKNMTFSQRVTATYLGNCG